MSRFQFHEFLAIDRPLGENEQKRLRETFPISRVTATSLETFSERDVDREPDVSALMKSLFDLHLMLTTLGTRGLTMRVPE